MFDTAFGLPLHPLVVHLVVVFLPLASVAVLLAALWPRFRRWAGPAPLVLAAIALVLVPISTQSGESLEHALGRSAAIEQHSEYADGLLPWMAAVFVVATAVWWWRQSERAVPGRFRRPPRWAIGVLMAAAVVVAVGATVQVALIGHSGAEAAWGDVAAGCRRRARPRRPGRRAAAVDGAVHPPGRRARRTGRGPRRDGPGARTAHRRGRRG